VSRAIAFSGCILQRTAGHAARRAASPLHRFGACESRCALNAATQEPLSTIAPGQPSGVPAWKTIPSWAVVGTADRVILPAEQLAMARHAGARITEVRAPHLSMISDHDDEGEADVRTKGRGDDDRA
jgi:hypothetical protein